MMTRLRPNAFDLKDLHLVEVQPRRTSWCPFKFKHKPHLVDHDRHIGRCLTSPYMSAFFFEVHNPWCINDGRNWILHHNSEIGGYDCLDLTKKKLWRRYKYAWCGRECPSFFTPWDTAPRAWKEVNIHISSIGLNRSGSFFLSSNQFVTHRIIRFQSTYGTGCLKFFIFSGRTTVKAKYSCSRHMWTWSRRARGRGNGGLGGQI